MNPLAFSRFPLDVNLLVGQVLAVQDQLWRTRLEEALEMLIDLVVTNLGAKLVIVVFANAFPRYAFAATSLRCSVRSESVSARVGNSVQIAVLAEIVTAIGGNCDVQHMEGHLRR